MAEKYEWRILAMRIYNYIFYKTYQILNAFDESPSFATIIVLCWLFLFNSCTLVSCVIKNKTVTTYFYNYIVAFVILVIVLHFLYFYRKGKHLSIIEKYKSESKRSSIIGIIGAFLYIILTNWIFFKHSVPNIAGILR
jgi:hypothetical protein